MYNPYIYYKKYIYNFFQIYKILLNKFLSLSIAISLIIQNKIIANIVYFNVEVAIIINLHCAEIDSFLQIARYIFALNGRYSQYDINATP